MSIRLSRLTRTATGWSDGLYDFNNDGFKDLFIATGDVQSNAELISARRSKQPNRILLNRQDGTFSDVSAGAGEDFQTAGLHRGAAFGDLDGDGRVDAVVTRLNEPAELFLNRSPGGHWLEMRLTGHRSNRDGIGALIHITGASGRQQWNRVTTSVGYGCSSDRTVHFGLGGDDFVKSITVQWPSGEVQTLTNVRADRLVPVEER